LPWETGMDLEKKKKRERICEMETAVLLVEEEAVKK